MFATVLFAVIIINLLFVINIEVIHYPQYAILSILLFPLIKNFNSTLIWTTIAGAVDEGYQYFYLAPNDTGYYDFNDVITDLIGASFGLLFLRSFDISNASKTSFWKSSAFYGLLVMTIVVMLLIALKVLSIYPDTEAMYQMVIQNPSGFWSKIHPNVTYHVVRPSEGLLITIFLWLFYSRIGHGSGNNQEL